MKRDIRVVDAERGVICETYHDERWYSRPVSVDGTSENKSIEFVPSVTWICDSWPKGQAFWKWLASRGWAEAEAIKAAAGEKGSKVHQGIARLLSGGVVLRDDCFENPRTLQPEPLTPEEYVCIMSFREWFKEVKPEVLDFEYTVWNEKFNYAGTVDLRCRINGKVWIVDVKTSPDVYPQMELQVSAYKHADPECTQATRLAILQLGYKRNKFKKWKWNVVKDKFALFRAVRQIWRHETEGVKPLQRDYPLEVKL